MDLKITDPEYIERFNHFAFDEVVNAEESLDTKTRYMAILATLLGCQGTDAFREMLNKALDDKVDPVVIKEVVYQATDYLGYGRVLNFLNITNELFTERNIQMPLEGQATTTLEDRLEKGIETQVTLFGDFMKDAWKAGTINKWLASNCFGDYYTRKGLTLAEREMITFCYIAAQGGCEPQLIAHAKGNMRMGNDKDYLMKVVLQCVPYIGYPRSLNAINCINKACE